jgi:integrase
MAITVGELLDEWFEYNRADLQPTSQRTTKQAIKELKAEFGALSVDAIKPRHIDQWATRLRAEGIAPGTIRRRAGVLGTAFRTGVRWELCSSNPVAAAELPRVTTSVKAPDRDTVKRALTEAQRNPKLYLFLRLAAVTGARRSELLALRRDDFDPDSQTLAIKKVHVPVEHGTVTLERTKTKRGARVIAVDAETGQLIEKWLSDHDSPWLFPARWDRGKPMHPTSITHEVNKIGKKLGVKLSPHKLRHYAATQGLAAGTPLPVLAARLGDAPGTIMSVYCSAIGSDDRGAADVLAASID